MTLECMSTGPRLLRDWWNSSLGDFAPSHWFRLQNIVPPPYTSSTARQYRPPTPLECSAVRTTQHKADT